MSYTVNELAKLAGVSVRTLHYYDEVGLVKPARTLSNGYRYYGEAELLRLQQVLFFRELEFPLKEIRRIMAAPGFDIRAALRDQKHLLELHRSRLDQLMRTIDSTLHKLDKEVDMADKDLYGGLSKKQMDEYAKEAKQLWGTPEAYKQWGTSEAYKQSQERVKKLSKEEMIMTGQENDAILKALVAAMPSGPTSPVIQALIQRYYDLLRVFYEQSFEMFRSMAAMAVQDERFKAYYEKFGTGLTQFLFDAILYFVEHQKK